MNIFKDFNVFLSKWSLYFLGKVMSDMGRKIGIIFVMMLVFFNIFGCSGGSYRITIGGLNFSHNKITGSYSRFTGNCFKMVNIKKGEKLKIAFSAVTEKGEIKSNIVDTEGKIIKTLKTGETVSIDKEGTYKLQVLGKKHRGSFLLYWERTKVQAP